jgi:hypothetical protein
MGGEVDPACAVVRDGGIAGINGVLGYDSKCQLDGSGGVCRSLLWMLNGHQAGADGSFTFEVYQTRTDGSPAPGYAHNGDQFRLENGKLYELYNVGGYVWRVFEPYAGTPCPQGVSSLPINME